jgi:hypothetical protein
VDDPWRFPTPPNRVLRSPRRRRSIADADRASTTTTTSLHDDGTAVVTKGAAQRVYRERVPHYPLPLSAVRTACSAACAGSRISASANLRERSVPFGS